MSKETKLNKHYRKIWVAAYGPIPKDSKGRSYEIHHINGDHCDNELSNLKLVTIEEHYNIHFSQGDWQACFYIAKRMRLSTTELGQLSSDLQKRRVEDGSHNFLDGECARKYQKGLVAKGIHLFQDSEKTSAQNLKRLKDGTHPFLDKEHQSKASAAANRKVISLDDGKIISWSRRKSHETKTNYQHVWITL